MPDVSCRIVEVCVFKFENNCAQYLLLRRAKDERVYPGLWQLVSGSIEPKEKALDAALRELNEETMLKPRAFWNVPFTNAFYDHETDVVNVSPMFAAQVDAGIEPRLSAEHDTYGWFDIERAARKLVWPGQRSGLQVVHDYIAGGQKASALVRLL